MPQHLPSRRPAEGAGGSFRMSIKRSAALGAGIGLLVGSSLAAAPAWATDTTATTTSGTFTFTIVGGAATITKWTNFEENPNVVIPDFLGGAPVTTIGNDAFNSDDDYFGGWVNSVVLPAHLTTIGDGAFKGNQISTLTLPTSVTTVGDEAFSGLTPLTSLTLNTGLTHIGEDAFSYASNLESLSLPSTVVTVGINAFRNGGLKSLALNNGLTSLGESAFSSNGLSTVEIPASVTSIGNAVFSLNNSLTKVYFDGDMPSTFTSATGSTDGSLVTGEEYTRDTLMVYYPAGNTSGYTSPTWAGYNTDTFVPVAPVTDQKTAVTTIDPGVRTASLDAITWNKLLVPADWSGVGSNLNFSHTSTEITSNTLNLNVNDASGSGAGWAVTLSASDFVWSASSNSTALSAPSISSAAMTVSVGTLVATDSTSNLPTVVSGPQRMGTTQTLLSAAANYGEGTYTAPVTVILTIPGNTRAGTYTSTLTTTMSVSP